MNNFIEEKEKTEERPNMWVAERFTPYDEYHHGLKKVFCCRETKYQNVMVADAGAYGRALFLDSCIQTTERDEKFYHEPLVQTPMILANRARTVNSVLILGGADGGAAVEALRWKSVERVVVVDMDVDVVNACVKHLSCIHKDCWDDVRTDLQVKNALDYIQDEENGQFDAIISDLTDPVLDSAIIELFTVEHFTKIKARLNPGGVFALQGGPLSLIESDLFPRICYTLEQVFETVLPAQIFAPTYGSPLALAIATDASADLPSMKDIDKTFESNLKSELEVLDGCGLHGLFGVPKCVRKAIKKEQKPFTKKDVPKEEDKNV